MSNKFINFRSIFIYKSIFSFIVSYVLLLAVFCTNVNAQTSTIKQQINLNNGLLKPMQNSIVSLKVNEIEVLMTKAIQNTENSQNLTFIVIGLFVLVIICLIWIFILSRKHKKTLNKYSKNKQKLTLSQKASKIAFLFWNLKTCLIETSPEINKLFSLEEIKPKFSDKLLFNNIHPDDLNRVYNAIKIVNPKKRSLDIEFRSLNPNGNIFWIHLIADYYFDNWGRPNELKGMLIDITDKKNAEAEALDRKKRLERAEQIAQLGNWVLDLKTNLLTLSDGAKIITGIDSNKITLNDFKNAIVQIDQSKFDTSLNNLISRDEPLQTEIRFRHVETNDIIHLSNYGIIDNVSKKIYVVSQDITEKHKLERQFIHAFIEAQETEKQAFGEDLHDGISQILLAESMYIEVLLKTNKNGKSDMVSHLSKIRELNLSAINEARGIAHGLMSKQLKEVGLIKALENICVDYNNSKTIEFNFTHSNLDEDEISKEIKIHIFRITQEISTNIIRHSLATKAMIVLTKNDFNILKLVIKDNGVGIDFDKMKKENKGSGIKNIERRVTLLNGTIAVDTEPNQGTCFTIEAPLYNLN